MSNNNTIRNQCSIIHGEKLRGLMTHIIVGYPDLKTSEDIANIMIEAGVDFLEVQIPFSDPMADGPTFMHANSIAVKNGITIENCFELLKRLRAKTSIPLLFMGYYNAVFRYGVPRFCKRARESGCSGIIFPDYPIDHDNREGLIASCREYGLDFIPVLNPAATDERIVKIVNILHERPAEKQKMVFRAGTVWAGWMQKWRWIQSIASFSALNDFGTFFRKSTKEERGTGFLYYGMRKGITGAKNSLDPDIGKNLRHLKEFTSAPLAVGWGISTPEHIRDLPIEADIAIIGSKTLDVYNERKNLLDVREFIKNLVTACRP